MNIAGPSRDAQHPLQRERVESTYEADLLGLLRALSIDEIDEMQTFFVRRATAGEPLSDHDMAMNDLLQQARALAVFSEDRALAQRIAAGEDISADRAPARASVAFPPPNNPRAATQRNDNQQQRAPAVRNNDVPSQTWGGWFSSVVNWAFGPNSSSRPGPANANPTVPEASVTNRPTGHDCVICQDPIRGAEIRVPCGHYYDIGCITDLFQSATRDETLYPPRCCRQNIPVPLVRPHLSQMLMMTLQQKEAEFSTVKRVYCSSLTCSLFLGPLSEGIFSTKVYTCPAPGCVRRTCGKCRGEHSGYGTHVCRPDADAAQVLELSRAAGWARCPGCSQVIELNLGCFHMTCRCRTEFCYLCRARWKTCRCPQWDERRLLAAAEERVDAQLGREQGARRAVGRDRPPVQPPPAPRRVPAFVPAPAPVPARRAVENPLANRTQQALGARPPAPALEVPPARLQRPTPTPTPTAPAPAPAPAALVRPPVPPPPATQVARSRATPASTSTVGSSGGSSTSTSSNSTGHVAKMVGRLSNAASTSIPPTNAGTTRSVSTWTSTRASVSASSSVQARPPLTAKSVSTATTTNIDTTRQRMVREMMEKLRVDHDCSHGRWHYRSGGGICQSCGHRLPLYLFRCQGCEMLACNRCRRNRL